MSARKIFIILGVVGTVAFLWFLRDDLRSVAGIILSVNWAMLLLLVPLQIVNYLSAALYYRSMLRSLGFEIGLWRLFKMTLGLTFTNLVLPSAGLSAVSLLTYTLKKDDVPAGKSTFMQFARYAITYASYLLLLFSAVLLLYFGDSISSIAIRIVVLIATGIVVLSVLGLYAVYDKRAFDFLARKVRTGVDWVSRKARGGKNLIGVDSFEQILREFHKSFREVMARRVYMKQPLLWSLLASVAEVASLYVIFMALGFYVNPGVIVLAYGVSSAFGFLTVLPGDIGVYELAMTTVFVMAGVPVSFAISATLIYRVTTKALLLLPGFYYYNQLVGWEQNKKPARKARDGHSTGGA